MRSDKKNNMEKVKKILKIIVLVVVAVVCSVYFYNQIIHTSVPIHSDDADSAIDLVNMIELGKGRISYWLSPLNMVNGLLYRLFGATELFIQVFFAFKYFVCILMAMFLAVYNKEKFSWWVLPLFVFFGAMPGCFGTASVQPLKAHAWTVAVPLLCLCFILVKGNCFNSLKKGDAIIIALISLYGIVEKDLLIAVNCWIPFVLYMLLYWGQNGTLKKYFKFVLVVGLFLLVLGKVFLGNFEYRGYGSAVSVFPSISGIWENIIMFVTSLLNIFNIKLIGENVFRFDTITAFLRLTLLMYSIGYVVRQLIRIFKNGVESIGFVDAVLAISAVVVICAYLFAGRRDEEIHIRYATYLYYIFSIMLVKAVVEFVEKNKLGLQVARVNVFSAFFVVCILVSVDNISMTREVNNTDNLAEQLKNEEGLEYGLGSFWTGSVISVLTEGAVNVQAAEYANETLVPYFHVWDPYESGNKFFNFIIEDPEISFGINEGSIIKTYGQYIEKKVIGEKKIYIYDYDIRTKPLTLNFKDVDYSCPQYEIAEGELKINPNEEFTISHFYATVGKIKIIIAGQFAEEQVLLKANHEIIPQMLECENGMLAFEITVPTLYEDLDLTIINASSDNVVVESITAERIDNSISIEKEALDEVYLTPGYYIFGFEGVDIKDTDAGFIQNGKTLERTVLNNGNQKVAYGIYVEEEGQITVQLDAKGMVESIFYQNELAETFGDKDGRIYTKNDRIYLHGSGTMLYGPYMDLEDSLYILTVHGFGLEQLDISFSKEGKYSFGNIMLIDAGDGWKSYLIDATGTVEMFEVIARGIEKDSSDVWYYTFQKCNASEIQCRMTYKWDSLALRTTGEKNEQCEAICLNAGEICYGPYITLLKGQYKVTISGENLYAMQVSATSDAGERNIGVGEAEGNNDDCMEYYFTLEETRDGVEIVLQNIENEDIKVTQYVIEMVSPQRTLN